jgi:hypothetical protein
MRLPSLMPTLMPITGYTPAKNAPAGRGSGLGSELLTAEFTYFWREASAKAFGEP